MKRTTPTGQKPIETDEEPSSKNKNELRAQWEEMRMTVCANGVVNIHNLSHGDEPGHTYSVMLDGATAVRCSCPHHVHRGVRCKHMIAVENRPLVVTGATVAADTYAPASTGTASTSRQVAADGGEPSDGRTDTLTVRCTECGERYELDTESGNDCPACGMVAFETINEEGERR